MNLISLKTAAEQLGIHRETLRRHAVDGTVPSTKVGLLWKFSPVALQKFVESGGNVSPKNTERS